jgi:hypothetical protein
MSRRSSFERTSPALHTDIKLLNKNLENQNESPFSSFISNDNKLLLFNTISLGGAATIYTAMAFLSADNPLLIVILFTCISLCTGASSCGFVRCGIDYGRWVD